MVMHARKPLKRISDGYFEKHQSHPYQKYSKNERRAPAEYGSSETRYTPLQSPNGNISYGHGIHPSQSGHSHHHYSHVVDDRGYSSSRNSYLPKGSEKERDRDYKSSRNKYTTESVRSPKERIKEAERERSNHERNESQSNKRNRSSGMNSVSRSSKTEKKSAAAVNMPPGSEWSEHISSLGKRYYYNCITEVSQWEKPKDFDARRNAPKDSTYTSRSTCEKSSRSRSDRREAEKSSKRVINPSDRYWNNRDNRTEEGHERARSKHASAHDGKEGHSLQDMDISPDRSTPLSENSYVPREQGSGATRPHTENAVPPVVVLDNSHQTTGSLLAAALPRIAAPVAGPSCSGEPPAMARDNGDTPIRDAGPPTPTHSENTDPHAPPLHLDQPPPRKMEGLGSYSSVVGGALHHAVPMLTPSLQNYVRGDLTGHVLGWPADILEKQSHKFTEEAYQLGCLQCTRVSAELKCSRSLVRHTEIQATLQEQKTAVVILDQIKEKTKVMSNREVKYLVEDRIIWKQLPNKSPAHKYWLNCKRIMYLRQQITRLEELKSQNSFMSDE